MSTAVLPEKITVSNRAIFQEIENEMVILDLAQEKYYGLDDIGAQMWQLLSEHKDTSIVLTHLKAYYDIDEATLSEDLAVLIEKLRDAGLVTVQE